MSPCHPALRLRSDLDQRLHSVALGLSAADRPSLPCVHQNISESARHPKFGSQLSGKAAKSRTTLASITIS